ncbi:MAG: hypothetical protein R3338_04520 [Thermoanaerobaculia bacterium]|nr:hypothetical protein [Thermoanaerobaculia bacterium]
MRSVSRVTLLVFTLLAVVAPPAMADHFVADCPLTFVQKAEPASLVGLSPHGIFKNGSVIYVLRGQVLTTLDVTDTGELVVAREDFLESLAANDVDGGVAYSNGYLFISSGAGIEIYDLRNTMGGPGGSAPVKVSRTEAPHYQRLVVQGNVLAGLYPATSLPCIPSGTTFCFNSIDLWSITDLSSPMMMSSISSASPSYVGFNDIASANGYLYSTGMRGTHAFDITDPALPALVRTFPTRGMFLTTNGSSVLGIGQETLVGVFTIGPGPDLNYFKVFHLPSEFNLSNGIMFHPQAWISDERLITMIDEKDPMTWQPARTIAFDVFDFSVPLYNGFDNRIYENVSYVETNEVLWNPIAVGPYVYAVGETSGISVYGACGEITGKIELDNLLELPCGGAEIHGWVTGQNKINNIEVFLDDQSLGFATITRERTDISSTRPVWEWAISVNLDETAEGMHMLRALATDSEGNERQFDSMIQLFPGPDDGNCRARRRTLNRR